MLRRHLVVGVARLAPLGALVAILACSGQAPGQASGEGWEPSEGPRAAEEHAPVAASEVLRGPAARRGVITTDLCPAHPGKREIRCMSHRVTGTIEADGTIHPYPHGGGNPTGYGPTDLTNAYGLPTTGGTGKWVAVVDAYSYSNLESDLAQYRTMYNLPACTTAGGCLKVLYADQNGETSSDPGPDPQGQWAGEEMLDVEMVSAACPHCNILVISTEGPDNSLYAAAQVAVSNSAGIVASAVSSSFGDTSESSASMGESYYVHQGTLFTASSGDGGFGASYPATSAHVLAVGGTSLTITGGRSETAWSSGGSGCSQAIPEPSWQTGKTDQSCNMRMEADVSADADPNTGVNTYCSDSSQCGGQAGWGLVGGTSASSPFVAAAFTALGLSENPNSWVYSHTNAFNDVTTGSNGQCQGNDYQCNAGAGYDGPTGWGSPNGSVLAGLGTTPCTGNTQCTTAGKNVCYQGVCVGCGVNSDCATATTPTCDSSSHTCRACTTAAGDCGSGLTCAPSGKCVQCTANSQCASPLTCDTTQNKCVQCMTNAQCSNPSPVCVTSTELCGPCTSNSECTGNSAGSYCNNGTCGTQQMSTGGGTGHGGGNGGGNGGADGGAAFGDTGSSGGCSVGSAGSDTGSVGAVGLLLGLALVGTRRSRKG